MQSHPSSFFIFCHMRALKYSVQVFLVRFSSFLLFIDLRNLTILVYFPWSISKMITKAIPVSKRIVISCVIQWGIPFWLRRLKTILEIRQMATFLEAINKTIILKLLFTRLSLAFLNTGTRNDTFQQSGKKDSLRHILKISATIIFIIFWDF